MAVRMASIVAGSGDPAEALADLERQLGEQFGEADGPHFAFVFYHDSHDDDAVKGVLSRGLPHARFIGGTSSRGLVGGDGLVEGAPVGLLTVTDPDGSYGVGVAAFDDDPAAAAEAALNAALHDADAVGELPELVWVYQTPGNEDVVLEGLKRVVGDRCPIIGGTAVDDGIFGNWRLLAESGILHDGVAVAVLFPSGGVGVAFQGGYEPVGLSGVVTQIGPVKRGGSDPRLSDVIAAIDDRPAAEVYDEWRGGILDPDWRTAGQDIKDLTSNDPLGIGFADGGGVTYFRLLQPAEVLADGGLRSYAAVRLGDRVHVMRGTKDGLVRRAASVVASATGTVQRASGAVAGGIVIYCVGCRIAVDDGIDRVVAALDGGFRGRPFLGCFTAGEQGPVLGNAIHANLMISAVVFGE